MKHLLYFFLFSCCLSGLWAQDSPVSNVNVRVSEEQDKVIVTYNLARNSRIPFYHITVNLSLDGQALKDPVGLSGDVGAQVTAGLGKKIVWDALQDVTSLEGELKVDVVSQTVAGPENPAGCTPIKTVPVYAGIGGVAVAGLGLLVSGLSKQGEGMELYEIYEANLDPEANIYNSLSRSQHYEEANGKYKSGSWLTIAGGLTLAAGGAALVNRLLKINAYNRRCAQGSSATTFYEPKLQFKVSTDGGPALGIAYTF